VARTLIAIGGPLHATDLEMPDDRNSYVDLKSSSSYIAKKLAAKVGPEEAYEQEVMIHETIVFDEQQSQAIFVDALMTRFFKGGKKIDAPPMASIETPPHAAGPAPHQTRSGLVLPS